MPQSKTAVRHMPHGGLALYRCAPTEQGAGGYGRNAPHLLYVAAVGRRAGGAGGAGECGKTPNDGV